MKNTKKQPSVPFWEPRRNEDGSMVIRVPGDTYIKPAFGKYRRIKKWGSYVTDDPRFGENSVVFIFYDSERQENVKEVITGLPEDLVSAMTAYDHIDLNLQRRNEENRDARLQDSCRDKAGDYHLGGLDQAAYEAYVREQNAPDEEETYGDDILIGALSEDYRLRNAQIRYMAEVVREALHRLPKKNRMVYIRLFGQCMKEVDIAVEMNIGKSAVSNHKKRIIDKMSAMFTSMGYVVPTKEEREAEKKAYDAYCERIEVQEREETAEAREVMMIRGLTELFYGEGLLDGEIRGMIEDDLDAAA